MTMEIRNEFGKSKVVVINVSDKDVEGLILNWDLNDNGNFKFMEKELIDQTMRYLPEYAMGYDTTSINQLDLVDYLREVASSVIRLKNIDRIKEYIDNKTPYKQWDNEIYSYYNSKGVFSELILHFLLRDIKDTLPLISKIYFKDSVPMEAHGFDAVHVKDNILWLGETKFYNSGKCGIKALISDLKAHFTHDYLNEQFVIISRALIHNNELRDEWIKKITDCKRLKDIFGMIRIPLLCIYEDNITTNIINELNQGGLPENDYISHVTDMKSYFDSNNTYLNKNNVEYVLMLLPVESKDRIVSSMLSKICSMQNI